MAPMVSSSLLKRLESGIGLFKKLTEGSSGVLATAGLLTLLLLLRTKRSRYLCGEWSSSGAKSQQPQPRPASWRVRRCVLSLFRSRVCEAALEVGFLDDLAAPQSSKPGDKSGTGNQKKQDVTPQKRSRKKNKTPSTTSLATPMSGKGRDGMEVGSRETKSQPSAKSLSVSLSEDKQVSPVRRKIFDESPAKDAASGKKDRKVPHESGSQASSLPGTLPAAGTGKRSSSSSGSGTGSGTDSGTGSGSSRGSLFVPKPVLVKHSSLPLPSQLSAAHRRASNSSDDSLRLWDSISESKRARQKAKGTTPSKDMDAASEGSVLSLSPLSNVQELEASHTTYPATSAPLPGTPNNIRSPAMSAQRMGLTRSPVRAKAHRKTGEEASGAAKARAHYEEESRLSPVSSHHSHDSQPSLSPISRADERVQPQRTITSGSGHPGHQHREASFSASPVSEESGNAENGKGSSIGAESTEKENGPQLGSSFPGTDGDNADDNTTDHDEDLSPVAVRRVTSSPILPPSPQAEAPSGPDAHSRAGAVPPPQAAMWQHHGHGMHMHVQHFPLPWPHHPHGPLPPPHQMPGTAAVMPHPHGYFLGPHHPGTIPPSPPRGPHEPGPYPHHPHPQHHLPPLQQGTPPRAHQAPYFQGEMDSGSQSPSSPPPRSPGAPIRRVNLGYGPMPSPQALAAAQAAHMASSAAASAAKVCGPGWDGYDWPPRHCTLRLRPWEKQ